MRIPFMTRTHLRIENEMEIRWKQNKNKSKHHTIPIAVRRCAFVSFRKRIIIFESVVTNETKQSE